MGGHVSAFNHAPHAQWHFGFSGVGLLAGALALFTLLAPATNANTQTTAREWLASAERKAQAGDPDGALSDVATALRLDPGSPLAYTTRGTIRQSKRDIDGAIEDFDRAIELDPNLAFAWLNRAYAKRFKQDFDGAIADATRAIELAPDRPAAYGSRGAARQAKGDLAGAIADYDLAIERNSRLAYLYGYRAAAKQANGDLAGAKADLVQAGKVAAQVAGGVPADGPSGGTLPHIASSTRGAGFKGSPHGRSDSTAPFVRQILEISVDARYGYTKENPIRVGPHSSGGTGRLYLNALLGAAGEPAEYERVGACCTFRTPNSPNGFGLLDIYRIRVDGSSGDRYLYVNWYDAGPPKIPIGFVQRVGAAL
jgi:hypothetical protein